jgi:archaemetzincin
MGTAYLIPVGTPDRESFSAVGEQVGERFGLAMRPLPAITLPATAFNPVRRQVESTAVLREVLGVLPAGPEHALVVMEEDLFIPMLTFVFGQAQLRGRLAVLSLARLRQEFYGLPANPGLLRARAVKEAYHELGHTYGLVHCPDQRCIMSIANSVQQVDLKMSDFCGGCGELLRDGMRTMAP